MSTKNALHRTTSGSSSCSSKSTDSYTTCSEVIPESFTNILSSGEYDLIVAQNVFPDFFASAGEQNSEELKTSIEKCVHHGQVRELGDCKTVRSKMIVEWYMKEYGFH